MRAGRLGQEAKPGGGAVAQIPSAFEAVPSLAHHHHSNSHWHGPANFVISWLGIYPGRADSLDVGSRLSLPLCVSSLARRDNTRHLLP